MWQIDLSRKNPEGFFKAPVAPSGRPPIEKGAGRSDQAPILGILVTMVISEDQKLDQLEIKFVFAPQTPHFRPRG